MKKFIVAGFIVFELIVPQICGAQGTTTFVSNIGQSSAGSEPVGSDSSLAVVFQTGTNTSGYFLNSVQLGMANSTGSPSDFTVMLYANGNPGGFVPGNSLATFIGLLDPSANGTYTYGAPEALMLSPSSLYFIIVSADTPVATGAYQWSYASTTTYNQNDGWFLFAVENSSNGGSTWLVGPRVPLQFALIGSAAPEPGVMVLLVVGGVGLIWWTKKVRGTRREGRELKMQKGN